jgi:D-xylose 1-dehydrogenase (NADP+, D-xylono-1,5-lactone-forming)
MDKVRWGLLSTARINSSLIPAIRAAERGELVAVASRRQRTAKSYAKRWEIPEVFGSYEALLESDTVDAVYIPLPNHLHAEWSIKAMQAGKHVLCEKPFATTLDEVDAMIAASRETGQVLMEAFMYLHHPQTKMVAEFVQSGRLGEVTLVRGVFNFFLARPKDIRLVPEFGGGSLWDVGVYPLSFSQYIMGEKPQWVFGDQRVGRTGVDLTFTGQLHYSGDRLAQISCSFQSPFHTRFEILGTKGRLLVTRPFTAIEDGQVLFAPDEGEVEELAVPQKELYLGQVDNMHAAILDGQTTNVSLAQTRNHVETVLALFESAKSGERVSLT